jgi:hypothetical protein
MRLSFPIAVALTLLILAGCGGSPTPGKTVRALGVSFEAPGDWPVVVTSTKVTAARGGDVVQVTTYPLAKAYDPALFDRVKPEVERVAQQLAAQLKATAKERTVTVDGGRALQFDLTHGDSVEQGTFVLRGKREFQLYCRRADATPCRRLVATFAAR